LKYIIIRLIAAAASFVFMWVMVSFVVSTFMSLLFPPTFSNALNLMDWRTWPGTFLGSGAATYWAYHVLRLRSPG
jgi:fucose permease